MYIYEYDIYFREEKFNSAELHAILNLKLINLNKIKNKKERKILLNCNSTFVEMCRFIDRQLLVEPNKGLKTSSFKILWGYYSEICGVDIPR